MGPLAWDLNPDNLSAPGVECTIAGILTCPVSRSNVPSCLSGLVQTLTATAIACPVRAKQGLVHLDRQIATVYEPLSETLLPCFVLEMFACFVVQLLVIFHKINNCLLVTVCKIHICHVTPLVA